MIRSLYVFLVLILAVCAVSAQNTLTVKGVVVDSVSGDVVVGATVVLVEEGKQTSSNRRGEFEFRNVNGGRDYTVRISHIGWTKSEFKVSATQILTDLRLFVKPNASTLGEVVVYGASRHAEKLTNAPAAIGIVTPQQLEIASSHGSVGKAMENLVGVDVVQNGSNDFNINSRGFNNSINRRMLVLVDGRDPSTPLINLNEWNALSSLLGDVASIEVVRGPGSALYGPNAYNGVVNIRTQDPRDVLGTRVSVTGGEYETAKAALRHAGQIGNLAYKVSLGYSHQLNYSIVSRLHDTTKPNNGLEYPGLTPDVWKLTPEARRPISYIGTARADYYLDSVDRVVFEGGYSQASNEFFVNQSGRILIQDVEHPFVRVAYNSDHINIQGSWQKRYTPTAQITYVAQGVSGGNSDVYSIDAQWNRQYLDSSLLVIAGAQHDQHFVRTGFDYQTPPGIQPLVFLDPDPQHGIFTGVYSQLDWQAYQDLKVVGALRLDMSNIVSTQLSPKLGIVYEPLSGQALRVTYNRSFLRPSFADFFRKSPAGLPVQLSQVERTVDSVTSALVGYQVTSKLGIDTLQQWNLGNPTLTPEVANSIEVGYKGTPVNKVFLEANIYWNRRTNLISQPLGGLAPEVYPAVKSNTGNAQADAIADSVLHAEVAKVKQSYVSRLSYYHNQPALVIAPRNIAVVDEWGLELNTVVSLSNELQVNASYAYLTTHVQDNNLSTQQILPNTSPHRFNIGAEYVEPNTFDVSVQLRYVEGYKWVAGLFEGIVPTYSVVNASVGYYVHPKIRLSMNAFNLLDRRHYEIFGGSILRRQVTGNVTVNF